ncbi:MAG: hypothetical protein ACFFD5_14225 [Candidatus Thorarchaeota archaeon]
MKKTKYILLFAIFLTISLSILPNVVPQSKYGYTFHGASGNEKTLKIKTVDSAGLTDLWGVNWTDVIENFGEGAENVGAKKKSLVTAVDFDAVSYTFDAVNYTTDNWKWTTGPIPAEPDDLTDLNVTSFYAPNNLTYLVNLLTSFTSNVTMHNAFLWLSQLPTPVAQYLGALVYEPRWGAVGNTIVHNAVYPLDYVYSWSAATYYQYLENCTETWIFDETYGAFIGYKLQDNESNVIYEFAWLAPGIPGFELTIFLGITAISVIGLIYTMMRKKK